MENFKHGKIALIIEAKGFEIVDENELEYGYQYILKNREIVNVYQNKKGRQTVVLQGNYNHELRKIFPKGFVLSDF